MSAGFAGDGATLHKVLATNAARYAHVHARPIPVHAAAQHLGNTLYYRRFFPYYAFCLCAGLDEEGEMVFGVCGGGGYESHSRAPVSRKQSFLPSSLSGRGAVYTYDAVGSHERVGYSCQGSGKDLIQPVLDNQLKAASPLVLPPAPWMSTLPLPVALDMVKAAFVAAGERDIYTGDGVEIVVITKDGVVTETLPLKQD